MKLDVSVGVDDEGQLALQGTELQVVIPVSTPGVVRLRGDQVAPRDQFVAFDGDLPMNCNVKRRSHWLHLLI